MNPFILMASLCPLVAQAQAPRFPGSFQERVAPGQYQPIPADSDLALEARAFVQHALPALGRIDVLEAYDAVVAGVRVKLLCAVAGSRWQFVVLRDLNAEWHLVSARRLGTE